MDFKWDVINLMSESVSGITQMFSLLKRTIIPAARSIFKILANEPFELASGSLSDVELHLFYGEGILSQPANKVAGADIEFADFSSECSFMGGGR